MTPDPQISDQIILTIFHWIEHALIAGGGLAVIVTYWLNRRKNGKAAKVEYARKEELTAHQESNVRDFSEVKGHLEKQYDLLVDVKGDMGKLKGKFKIK